MWMLPSWLENGIAQRFQIERPYAALKAIYLAEMLKNYKEKFANIYHMICILQSFPVSMATVERKEWNQVGGIECLRKGWNTQCTFLWKAQSQEYTTTFLFVFIKAHQNRQITFWQKTIRKPQFWRRTIFLLIKNKKNFLLVPSL